MSMPDKEYYRNLITSEYRLAPRFNAMVRKMVDYNCLLDAAVLRIVNMFDVDSARGNQLDILGACVGVSRNLSFETTPNERGEIVCPTPTELSRDTEKESIYAVYKTPIPTKLSDSGVICGPAPAAMDEPKLLTDDIFRMMVKARIMQNVWKGNVLDLYELWQNLFPDSLGIQIQDLQDMSYNIVLIGDYPSIVRKLILHGYIIPKPQGVRINMLSFVSTDGMPIFAYDYNTLNYSGYKSHWLQTTETRGDNG